MKSSARRFQRALVIEVISNGSKVVVILLKELDILAETAQYDESELKTPKNRDFDVLRFCPFMAHSKRLVETVSNLFPEVIYLFSFSSYVKIDFQNCEFLAKMTILAIFRPRSIPHT